MAEQPNTDAATGAESGSSEAFYDPNAYAVDASAPKPEPKEEAKKPDQATEGDKPAQSDAAVTEEGDRQKEDAKPDVISREEHEREVERRTQEAIRKREEKVQREASEKASKERKAEIRKLVETAKSDGPEAIRAQRQLLQEYMVTLEGEVKEEDVEPVVNERLTKFANEKWEEYTSAFGLKTDDPDLAKVDPKDGMRGLTEVFISKTESKPVVKAMLNNPVVKAEIQKRIDAAVAKESEAAKLDGVAKAIGDSPSIDGKSGKSVGDMTPAEIEIALFNDPHNPNLKKAWRKAFNNVD